MTQMIVQATTVTVTPVSTILASIVSNFGFKSAEAVLELLDYALKSYNVGATYNTSVPYIQETIREWKAERGKSEE